MSETTAQEKAAQELAEIDLKDRYLAAALAWLVPGLGHIYQGRRKGIIFTVCILGTFLLGIFLSGSSDKDVGWGRAVYVSFKPRRLAYICQIGAGGIALPALVQYQWAKSARKNNQFVGPEESPLGTFMWPPTSHDLDTLHRKLHRNFELGTVLTMIAGLLNILAIYDAWGGPVLIVDEKAEKKKKASQQEPATAGAES